MCNLTVLEELNGLSEGVSNVLLVYVSQLKGVLSYNCFPDLQ